MSELTNFQKLYSLDVNHKVAEKNKLKYLSWAYAWAEFKKIHPDATYKIIKNQDTNLPYFCDEKTGYTVFTEVTADNQTHEMWLFVMDGANKAMKTEPYTYKVKDWKASQGGIDVFIDKTVETASMFDINKTIMRCLVKNLAMFGLGLYIYEKEDFPEQIIAEPDLISDEQKNNLLDLIGQTESDLIKFLELFNVSELSELYVTTYPKAESMLLTKLKKMESKNAK